MAAVRLVATSAQLIASHPTTHLSDSVRAGLIRKCDGVKEEQEGAGTQWHHVRHVAWYYERAPADDPSAGTAAAADRSDTHSLM